VWSTKEAFLASLPDLKEVNKVKKETKVEKKRCPECKKLYNEASGHRFPRPDVVFCSLKHGRYDEWFQKKGRARVACMEGREAKRDPS